MLISDTAVTNRTTVFVLTAVIVIAGVLSYINLPLESAPDVQVPFVFVTTSYRGVSPEDIEQSITVEIEKKLKGLEGIKEITSVSVEGLSFVNVEFQTDVDIDDAVIKVKDKVDLAKPELPNDIDDEPVVEEMNFSELPILILSLAGPQGLRRITDIADELEEDIEAIAGVLDVEVVGGVTREVHIRVDPNRLALYGLPIAAVEGAIRAENANVSGGAIKTGEGRYQVRVPGEFEATVAMEEIVVGARGGEPVYLRDVADVRDTIKDRESYARTNGQPSVNLYIKKRSGENIVEIVEAVDAHLAEAQAGWPAGVQVVRVMDQAKEIHEMVADLENNILSGLLLVIIVVTIALGPRNALLVSLSIPLSMLITFVVLRMLDITLNMVVLFSLTLALGMLVDNAIVIVENIYRFIQQGVPRVEAAMRASSEVAWPIIGSALTTIFAFTPLLAWGGIMGGFMIYLPKTVIIALASCLFVALVINPALAAVLMKENGKTGPVSADEVMGGGEHPMLEGGGLVLETYRRLLRGALKCRLAVALLATLVLVSMIAMWVYRTGLENPIEFFPSIDPNRASVNLTLPQGADVAYADRVVREAACRVFDKRAGSPAEREGETPLLSYEDCRTPHERTLRATGETYTTYSDLPLVRYVYERSAGGSGGVSSFFGQQSDNQVGVQFVEIENRFDDQGNRLTSKDVIKAIDARIVEQGFAGAEVTVDEDQEGPPTGKPVNIEISGDRFETLGRLAEQVKALVQRVPHVKNVESDYEAGAPTVELTVDRKRATLLGLSTRAIGDAIRSAIAGAEVSTFREEDEDFDIYVRFQEADRRQIDTLRRVMLPASTGRVVPLTTVARIDYTGGLGRITRIDNRRTVTVQADVDSTKTTGDTARKQAEELMAGLSYISSTDVLDWPALAARLVEQGEAETPTPAGHVWSRLGADARQALRTLRGVEKGDPPFETVEAARTGMNEALKDFSFYDKTAFDGLEPPAEAQALLQRGVVRLDLRDRVRLHRLLLETAWPDLLAKSPPVVHFPPGYRYQFTGEHEFQKESEDFLTWAMGVALVLIIFVLVAQFNSVTVPLVIMSAVVLSIGGVFLGLGVHSRPFGIIMTGVGTISLAGVVVNNAIVLVDYIQQLEGRGLARIDAIVAAGATRLRPVILTATTTILGLVPMATGKSIDFQPIKSGHLPTLQLVSESSQWWGGMAVAVIYGLALATMLTLFVVPALYSLVMGASRFVRDGGYFLLLTATGAGAAVVLGMATSRSPWTDIALLGLVLLLLPLWLATTTHERWLVRLVCRGWWALFDKAAKTDYAARWR